MPTVLFQASLIPAVNALGVPISGAQWRFTLEGTTTPAAVYDGDGSSLGASVTANSAGRFVPIYLDTGVDYRARLYESSSATDPIDRRDVDPVSLSQIDQLNVKQFGAAGDGTDQTTEVVAGLTALGASAQRMIFAPIDVRMDLQQVVEAIPNKSVMSGVTVFQTGTGYRQQVVWDGDNPPDANTDTARLIISTHYPDLMLNNLRTAGTISAGNGLSGLSWARGFYRNGSKGPRVQWQANFTKSSVRTTEYSNNGVGCYIMRTRSPERAGNYEEWFNGIVVAIGDYILATNGYFYRATTAGTSTVSPTVTSGTQTVGGITWQFESAFVGFGSIFYVDELGRVGSTPVATGITQHWLQNPEDTENFVVRYDAGGNSKAIEWRLRPTNSGGTLVAIPYLQATESAGFRALDSTATRELFAMTDARGLILGTHGYKELTASEGDTTPSVAGATSLVLSNAGATSITDFEDYLPNQRIEVYATNGNTTLVHSSLLVLTGATNVTLVADQVIGLRRNPANTFWREIYRNF